MAADVPGHAKEHWIANAGVIGVVLLAALAPLVGAVLIVPCLVSAKRAGANPTPYVIALAVNVVWTVVVYAVQAQIQPV